MRTPANDDALWYKDAIIYEVHVRAFYDSQGDGMGDFAGLTQKLDYLQDLGVTAVWVLPFYPSPWRDDGYDISDYYNVHPAYGTLEDFKTFLQEAHRRGLKVITEVVINHTSDQHPWFQRARRSAPGTEWRDFYVWSDTPDKYKEARIIFKDFETSNWTWDPLAKAYFWHRFYSHQPDLNFDSPRVRQAVLDVIDFWFGMGVDAFRLDAIPYLYERPDTNCENLPETHAFLKEIRRHVDEKFPNRMLLAEANQWPEDSIAYFGNGDECNMAFHFPLMPRLFMANRMEDRYPIVEILGQTPAIPETCQWALFLRNHDELTLEMVTDEERDYMYRTYASDRQTRLNLGIRRRLAPLLGNDRRKIELMNALLFSLPGSPVIYYGDEIGMGDNIYLGDRNGVRTPMQWSADRNAGFSRASAQKLYLPITFDPEYHYEAINVQTQSNNINSLLWWMKRLIEQRKKHKAFGRGTLEFIDASNRKVLAFFRKFGDETLLVVANLSRYPQHVELDLSSMKGKVPVELFGGTGFPVIGDQRYVITLSGHVFYWMSLEQREPSQETTMTVRDMNSAPAITIRSWNELRQPDTVTSLIRYLPRFLKTRRWFLGKERVLRNVSVQDVIPVTESGYIIFVRIDYADGDPDFYLLPMAAGIGPERMEEARSHPDTAFIRVKASDNGVEGVLYGGLWNRDFCNALLHAVFEQKVLRGSNGALVASRAKWADEAMKLSPAELEPVPSRAEQSNSSVTYGDRMVLKLFRRAQPGINPEAEMIAFLLDHGFTHAPRLFGTIEHRTDDSELVTAAVLQEFIPNHGDAWKYTIDALSRYYEQAEARTDWERLLPLARRDLLELSHIRIPSEAHELLQSYLESAHLLGRRSAEMHLALTDVAAGPDFVPEPFADDYRQGLYYGMFVAANRTFEKLREKASWLNGMAAALVAPVLAKADLVRAKLRRLRETRIHAVKIRNHGAFHLAQVLYTGKDFYIIDFEGDPSRPIGERRLKRSPLRDVAGMLRSIDYAAQTAIHRRLTGVVPHPETLPLLESAAYFWSKWASAAYLSSYLETAGAAPFLPVDDEQTRILLECFLLERALFELSSELDSKPEDAAIPLRGILNLLS